MQNEILSPVLDTDETAIPRYDIVDASGNVLYQNVKLQLKNTIVQEGTPYDTESVLPSSVCTKLGIPATSKPADAFGKLSDSKQDKSTAITTSNIASQNVNKAKYATDGVAVGTPALRNQYFASAESTPTVNGQICWVYG